MVYDVLGFTRPEPEHALYPSVLQNPTHNRLAFVVTNPLKTPQTMSEMGLHVASDTGRYCEAPFVDRYRLARRLDLVVSSGSSTRKVTGAVESDEDPGFVREAEGSYTESCHTIDLELRFNTSLPIPAETSVSVSLDVPRRVVVVKGNSGRHTTLALSVRSRDYVELAVTLAPSGKVIQSCVRPCQKPP
jgi:hypothetical protein